MNKNTNQRVEVRDWGKAAACSAIIFLVLLLLLLLFTWNGSENGSDGDNIAAVGGDAGEGAITRLKPGGGGGGVAESGKGPGEKSLGGDSGSAEESTKTGGGSNTEKQPPSESGAEKGETTSEADEEVEKILKNGFPAVDKIAMIQSGEAAPPSPEGSAPQIGGTGGKNVGGMYVKGNSLGVVLDISFSMSPYLADLRREITREFKDAAFLEVPGCHLSSLPENRTNSNTRSKAIGPRRSTVMQAIVELVEENKVDSIFWFCDLQDGEAPEALIQLRELLEKHRVHLYIRSTGRKPQPELDRIIRESGGSFQQRSGNGQ